MEQKCNCNHDIIFLEEVYNEETKEFELKGKCILCGKFLLEDEINELNPHYTITSDIILKDGSRSSISYDLLKRSAKKIKEKYLMFTGQDMPIDTLYSLLTEYFRIAE